jgi:hypothetical protein
MMTFYPSPHVNLYQKDRAASHYPIMTTMLAHLMVTKTPEFNTNAWVLKIITATALQCDYLVVLQWRYVPISTDISTRKTRLASSRHAEPFGRTACFNTVP